MQRIKYIYFKLQSAIEEVLKLAAFVLIVYGSVWSVAYARANERCLHYEFEITQVTWNLKPYCGSLWQGSEIVKPLPYIIQRMEAIKHSGQGL